jgi:hypothetical protein
MSSPRKTHTAKECVFKIQGTARELRMHIGHPCPGKTTREQGGMAHPHHPPSYTHNNVGRSTALSPAAPRAPRRTHALVELKQPTSARPCAFCARSSDLASKQTNLLLLARSLAPRPPDARFVFLNFLPHRPPAHLHPPVARVLLIGLPTFSIPTRPRKHSPNSFAGGGLMRRHLT